MKAVKRPILAAVLSLLVIAVLCVVFYARIVVMVFAMSNNLDISYKKIQSEGFTVFIFTDLKITQRDKAMGALSSKARAKIIFDRSDIRKTAIDFLLNDVHFITSGIMEEASYNNIDSLIATPFNTIWNYKEISGKISSAENGIRISDFKATGDSIKLSFDGIITRDGYIKADIGISFGSALIGKIPPELTSMVLKDSTDGWKSLTVKLEGNLSKPSIQVTGKLFRLNIGLKSEKTS